MTVAQIVDAAVKEVADRNHEELTLAWAERDEFQRLLKSLAADFDREARADSRVDRAVVGGGENQRQYLQSLDAKMRRYQLLQAAATIGAAQCNSVSGVEQDAPRLAKCANALLTAVEQSGWGR